MMKNISATTSSNKTPSIFIDLPSKTETIVWYSVYALEAVLIVAGNSLTIALFAVNKRLRKKSLFLIMNMAFADLLYGAVLTPFKIYLMHDGYYYQLSAGRQSSTALSIFYTILFTLLKQNVLMSAVLISAERFYAIYWPLKHRILPICKYYIVIFISWTLAFLASILFSVLFYLTSIKLAINVMMSCFLTLLLTVSGCNVGIWRNFRHRRIASAQPTRDLQNRRLTKTLLLVSIIVLISWLPGITVNVLKIVHEMSISWNIYHFTAALNVSNSLLNPVIYTLRIPEFKRALSLAYFRLQAALNKEGQKRRDKKAVSAVTSANQLRAFETNLNHLELTTGVCDTKL